LLAHRLNPDFFVGHLKHCANAHTEIASDPANAGSLGAGRDDPVTLAPSRDAATELDH